jgi:2-polyprenyl-3-methyl-5-hydroxy-6-metoxy-1,4-benzoquinol methylase
MATGGTYVIETLARELSKVFRVNLVVQFTHPRHSEGVRLFHSLDLRPGEIPDADAIVLYADAARGEHFASLPASKGKKFLLFMGYNVPKNPYVVSNLMRNFMVVARTHWLVGEALNYGCLTAYTPLGNDRTIFHRKGAKRNPNLVAMMTHSLDWKGTADGVAALTHALSTRPQTEIELFGRHDPHLPGAHYLGILSRNEVADLMRRASVFVCSSWEEGFGRPGMEAMFCGAALATTDTKGSRDYAFDGETALVSPPRDPESLGQNILRLLEEEELRETIAEQGHRYVTRHYLPWDEAAFLFVKAIASLTSRRERASKPTVRPNPQKPLFYLDSLNTNTDPCRAREPITVNPDKEPALTLSGWAVDPLAQRGAAAVILTVDEHRFLFGGGHPRPDVATHFGVPSYGDAGFTDSILTQTLGLGRHTLRFRVLSFEGTSYFDTPEQVELIVDDSREYTYRSDHFVIGDFSEFSGLSTNEIEHRIRINRELLRQDWKKMPGESFREKAKQFYGDSENYLFNLLSHSYSKDAVVDKLNEFTPLIMKSIKDHPGRDFLEFGGGTGVFCEVVAALGKHATYLDIPGQHFNFARWRFKKHHIPVEMISSSPETLTLTQNYDTIFSDAVLEHLIHPEKVMHELCKHLKRNGILILLVDLSGESEMMPLHRNVDIHTLHADFEKKGLVNEHGRNTFCSIWRKS